MQAARLAEHTCAPAARIRLEPGFGWLSPWPTRLPMQELCSLGTLARAMETGKLRDPATKKPRLSFVMRTVGPGWMAFGVVSIDGSACRRAQLASNCTYCSTYKYLLLVRR
jgi:hypothetical protein